MSLQWYVLDTWIVVAGSLSAMACALLGNFLVLRRLSMMGDAISHAVLPGLAIAFLVTGSRDSIAMLLGAGAVGVLTAVLTQWIHNLGRVEESASMGVVFTSLFAIGLILIVRAADHVDLDPGCVLYGAIESISHDTVGIAGLPVPRTVVTLTMVFTIDMLFILLFYKELKITSFDPDLATTLGINASVMHYALMTLVAATTVACFESVGSILVIAMMIVPAAAAHLLTDRLWLMILTSQAIALVAAAGGHVSAITVPRLFGFEDTNTAGMMAVVAGAIFTVVLFAAPRHGLVSRWLHRSRLSYRILKEDVLGLLYRLEEDGIPARPQLVAQAVYASPVITRLAIRSLLRQGRLAGASGSYTLTELGRREAARLVRSHRLWESYLYKHLGLAPDHVHGSAERLEHVTRGEMLQRLAQRTSEPTHDPQGKRIPEQT